MQNLQKGVLHQRRFIVFISLHHTELSYRNLTMESKNHWMVARERKVRVGRPSKVDEVLGMDLSGYYEGAPEGFGVNEGAGALVEWLKGKGEEISIITAKRVIWRLIKDGRIDEKAKGSWRSHLRIKATG